jgi:hypothetical protein
MGMEPIGVFCRRLFAVLLLGPGMCVAANVTTQHSDNFRTGWNWQETALTPAVLTSGAFANLVNIAVDEQVDAQPLVLSNQGINGGPAVATVVYVATENNSVYAIDAATGAILAATNLEPAFPVSTLSNGSCGNNSSVVGIQSTPVIDVTAGTLYVVTTVGSGNPVYHLHALSTGTLTDKVAPLTIANPSANSVNRQRSALTLFNGGVLIPFSSFCDHSPSTGFVTYANMTGSPASQVALRTSTNFLASVWMSGGGPAVSGNSIYFTTGNGSTSGPYPPSIADDNLAESLVQLQGSAGVPLSLAYASQFTPVNYASLDAGDTDFGAGSVLIIPQGAPASIVDGSTAGQFVTAVGKDANLYVNGLALGPSYVQDQSVGAGCDCVYSYFTGSDAVGHVAMSAGTTLGLYNVSASGLTLATSAAVATGTRTNGFSTSVSSNGTQAGTGIIWAVSGPTSAPLAPLILNAYDAGNLQLLFARIVGAWPNTGGNANVIPVVANGKVLIGNYKQLSIWGSTGDLVDTPTMVAACGIPGFEKGICGSMTPATTSNGYTYQYFTTQGVPRMGTFVGKFSVSGFSSDPGSAWLMEAICGGSGLTQTAGFTYTYSAGTATWNGSSGGKFPLGATLSCNIVHK